MVTLTPGSTASDESVTRPLIAPVVAPTVCACVDVGAATASSVSKATSFMRSSRTVITTMESRCDRLDYGLIERGVKHAVISPFVTSKWSGSCLTLKIIARVRACTSRQRPQSGNQIRWYESRSPDFTLADMHSLMSPRGVQRPAIACQDDVTKCNGGSTAGDGHAVPQNGGDEGPVRFQHATNDLHSAAREHRRRDEQQADERVRQRPRSEERRVGKECRSRGAPDQ